MKSKNIVPKQTAYEKIINRPDKCRPFYFKELKKFVGDDDLVVMFKIVHKDGVKTSSTWSHKYADARAKDRK